MGVSKCTLVCAFVTLGECYCAVEGKTCDYLHPTGLELKKI